MFFSCLFVWYDVDRDLFPFLSLLCVLYMLCFVIVSFLILIARSRARPPGSFLCSFPNHQYSILKIFKKKSLNRAKPFFLQHEFLMDGGHGGEPLYAQINRELKTKRIHSAANTLTKSEALNASKQIYDHYDLDVGHPSKSIYQNDNRTDSAKLQNSVAVTVAATVDSTAFYKNFHNNNNNNNSTNINTNTDQNQWV